LAETDPAEIETSIAGVSHGVRRALDGCQAVLADQPSHSSQRGDGMKAVVIGAGIGGLTTHLVCRRAGIDVEHHEQVGALGPAGAGIVMWPNGLKILLAITHGTVTSITNPISTVVTRDPRGEVVSSSPVAELEDRLGAPVSPVSRTDLQSLLIDAVGSSNIRLGSRCVSAETRGDAAVVRFADGTEAVGDFVVGADGIHSTVRQFVAPGVKPTYVGIANWVALTANDGLLAADEGVEFLGAGLRCGVLPLTGDRLYVGFAGASPHGSHPPDGGWLTDLRHRFGTWPEPIPAVLDRLTEADVKYLEIHDLPVLDRWCDGRVALLGDAAHATAPTMGQGGCQAMEDAIHVVRCVTTTTLGVPDALRRYELTRRERAEAIVAQSRRKAESLHSPDPAVLEDTYRAIRETSVSESLAVLEQLLSAGPFG
jgi:FAD-dependent urate hydroxylase